MKRFSAAYQRNVNWNNEILPYTRELSNLEYGQQMLSKQELSFNAGRKGKIVLSIWNTAWRFLTKLKHTFPLRFSKCVPWYLHKGVESHVYIKTWTWMFTASLFILQKLRRNQEIKMSYSSRMDKYKHSRLKRIELSSHEKMWRNLKSTLLSEGSQSEKAT